MFGFAMAAYVAVFVAFILLVIDTSKNYVNEVTIMSTDLTGKRPQPFKQLNAKTLLMTITYIQHLFMLQGRMDTLVK